MATEKSTPAANVANNNVELTKEEKRRLLLAKALGKKPEEVTVTPENPSEKNAELAKKAVGAMKEKSANKEQFRPKAESKEVVESIVEDITEGSDDDDLEIIEVPPVVGKKVIPQNSKQAEKILAKEAEKKAKEAIKPVPAPIKKEVKPAPAPAPEKKKLTPQEISAKALAAKRAKKAERELAEKTQNQPISKPNTSVKKESTTPAKKEPEIVSKSTEKLTTVDPLLQAKVDKLVDAGWTDAEIINLMGVNTFVIGETKKEEPRTARTRNVPPATAPVASTPKKEDKPAPKKENKKEPAIPKRKRTKDTEKFTRFEAMGIIMKNYPNSSAEEHIQLIDQLFSDVTGKPSNIKQTKFSYGFAVNFLQGYNK